MLNNANAATVIYSYIFVIAAVFGGVSLVARHYVKSQTAEIREILQKITYALYNDGQTGLINKVDHIIETQQAIKIDVEVLKAKRTRT